MPNSIEKLQPTALWTNFAALNAVPRPSKQEERVIAFIKDFGENLGLPTQVDAAGNVIIKKPATPGRENRQTVVLQSHLDMVHQKNTATDFDFQTQGIRMYVEGDWVKAEGTTLGADNGIGVATIMALLQATDIPHPPLEALFTIDEETGMTGAKSLQGGLLAADIMLNLDTEDDDELTIGCAGGIDVTAEGDYLEVSVGSTHRAFALQIQGLSGGHSGMDIHKGLGNANKLMNRLLYTLDRKLDLSIHAIDGGGLRNAIPRESTATVLVQTTAEATLHQLVDELGTTLQREYASTDPDLQITLSSAQAVEKVLDPIFQRRLLQSIYACPSGIYRMSPDIADLVQTSNNLARVLVKDGQYRILCLTRSSVDSEKQDEVQAISSVFELLGATVTTDGAYPGWTPAPGSAIVRLMSDLYRERFAEEPQVKACHAGLECGILGTNYPDMEMISFGPNIRGAHSPDEKVQISSVQKFWDYLLATLQRIPEEA